MTESTGLNYERSDVDPVLVGWLALGLGVFVIAVPLLVPFAFPQSINRAGPLARPVLRSDAPALSLDPASELHRQQEQARQLADSYAWVNRDRVAVRIPITRAMERLSQTGLPGWPLR